MARRHFVTRNHVAHGVVPHVPHVDTARRIGEHFQHVVFRFGFVTGGGEDTGLFPFGLPFLFDVSSRVLGHSLDLWDMETPGDWARRGHNAFCGRIL